MRNISTKVNRDLLTPGEFNSMQDELENIVTNTGGTLDAADGPDNDLNMLGKAGATYGSAGDFYEDSSAIVNYIILERESNLEEPQSYKAGLKVIFKAASTNTGATTINIAGLGDKDLKHRDGSALSAGDITLNEYIITIYNNTYNRFDIIYIAGSDTDSLTNNSVVDSLHRHSKLVSPDGTTDPVFSISNDGKASFPSGTGINEFSTDGTLAGDSDNAVPTIKAVKTYNDASKNYSYFADYNETDQGATGNGLSIKALVDIIDIDTGKIILRHNSGAATTTYTLTTSETIPSNITLEIEPGAIIDGAGTLTINGPRKIGDYQVFGAVITVVFGSGVIGSFNPKWFGTPVGRGTGYVYIDETETFTYPPGAIALNLDGILVVKRECGDFASTEQMIPTLAILATGKEGDAVNPMVGLSGAHILVKDEAGATNPCTLVGLRVSVHPLIDRASPLYDDIAGVSVENATGVSGKKATDAFYVSSGGPTGGWAWACSFNTDARSQYCFKSGGVHDVGLDLENATINSGGIKLPNDCGIFMKDSGGTQRQMINMDSYGNFIIGYSMTGDIDLGFANTGNNPIQIRVNGVNSKQITVDAVDTAGAGFRALRVPN